MDYQAKDWAIINVTDPGWEPDQYGNKRYQIELQGYGDMKVFWNTQVVPKVGDVHFGHLQLAASGKSMGFKKDKKEGYVQQGAPLQQGYSAAPSTDPVIQALRALYAKVQAVEARSLEIGNKIDQLIGNDEGFMTEVKTDFVADDSHPAEREEEPIFPVDDEPFDMDSIPFN